MKRYPEYLGTIANDEIKTLLPKIQPHSKIAFIINTDDHEGPGVHWKAIYIDATPGGSQSCELFDSFGRDFSPQVMRDLSLVIDMLRPASYLKLKINRVVHQFDDTNTCGYHAANFLIDRLRGKTFVDATGFNPTAKIHGEENYWENKINTLKEEHKFGYI